MRIFAGVPGERGVKRQWGLSMTAIFSVFGGYISETLEIRPALLYGDKQSLVGL